MHIFEKVLQKYIFSELLQLYCQVSQSVRGKCSKIVNTFLFLFSIKMSVFRTEMFVRIADRVDPDQTASSEAVC